MLGYVFHTLQPWLMSTVSSHTRPCLAGFQRIVVKDGCVFVACSLEAILKLMWSLWGRTSAVSLHGREPLSSAEHLKGPASSWQRWCCGLGGWCRVLPCSRSCWSYHGSSSSVMNSSILPELSMGDPPRKSAETSPSVWTIDLWVLQKAAGAPSRRSCAQAVFSRGVLFCGSTCFLLSSLSAVFTPASPSHPPTAQQRPIPVLRPAAAAAEDPTDVAETLLLSH